MADDLFDLSEIESEITNSRDNVDRLVFVVNNYTQEEWDGIWNNPRFSYLCMSKEVGKKKGTPHIQGYLEMVRCKFSVLKKCMTRAKFIRAKGTAEENVRYTSKEANPTWVQRGTPLPPKQPGARTDLKKVSTAITEGKLDLDTLAIESPILFCKYYKAWERCEYIHLRKQYRNWMTEGLWFWGPTGTGKSHSAYQNYNPSTHYVLCTKNGWWDGYRGQPIVIINDLKPGEIDCGVMLNIVDKWPYKVPIRGKEAVPFLARLVIVTSSMEPKDLYNSSAIYNSDKDSGEQLERRFTSINLTQRCSGVILDAQSPTSDSQERRSLVEQAYRRAFSNCDSEVKVENDSEVKENL